MYLKMAKRLLVETDKRLLGRLVWNAGVKGIRSVQKHKHRLKRGEFFPPFLYISIINSCNLRCQGCWVDVAAKQQKIDLPAMDRLISEAKAMGKEGGHLSIRVGRSSQNLVRCVWWNHGSLQSKIQRGMVVDLVGRVKINEFRGNYSAELDLLDMVLPST